MPAGGAGRCLLAPIQSCPTISLHIAPRYLIALPGCLCLFFSCLQLPAGRLQKPFIYLGKISYGLYVFHVLWLGLSRDLIKHLGGGHLSPLLPSWARWRSPFLPPSSRECSPTDTWKAPSCVSRNALPWFARGLFRRCLLDVVAVDPPVAFGEGQRQRLHGILPVGKARRGSAGPRTDPRERRAPSWCSRHR